MNQRSIHTPIAAAICMLVLILDSHTAMAGAKSGIDMCLQSVIPALFPFFILSILLTTGLTGRRLPMLRPLVRFTGIPGGSESILLTGLLGGYPVGAQAIRTARASGTLSDAEAARMVVFCNNAGPAFIFGITAWIFPIRYLPWLLWFIQILSALLTGYLLPGKSRRYISMPLSDPPSLPQALFAALRTMASVCGWVVVFRILLVFLERWLFWLFPRSLQVLLIGILELTNGCVSLSQVEHIGLRFLLCAGMLSFGGLCVWLQTLSVADTIGLRKYLPGKLLQSTIAVVLALLSQHLLPEHAQLDIPTPLWVIISLFFVLFLPFRQKSSSIPAEAGV